MTVYAAPEELRARTQHWTCRSCGQVFPPPLPGNWLPGIGVCDECFNRCWNAAGGDGLYSHDHEGFAARFEAARDARGHA